MRELKFRVWFHDPDTGHGMFVNGDEAFKDDFIDWYGAELSPTDACSIIEQFTGMHDKNGTEIYEGDIVSPVGGLSGGRKGVAVVEYEGGGFTPFAIPRWEVTVTKDDVEVIGNIHDNREPLEAT